MKNGEKMNIHSKMSAEIRANYNDKIPMETGQKYSKESHIPVLSPTHFKRTGSLKLRNEMRINQKPENTSTPTIPLRRHRSLQGLTSPILPRRIEKNYERDEDLDSEKSFGSSCNSLCGHSPFAHNGTTYSARNMKYIFHCSTNSGSEEYLTPTQRANRTIKRLRRMLADAQSELIEKDSEINRLTKEIVELRLMKAGNNIEENESCVVTDETDFVEAIINKSSPRFMDVLHEEHDGSSINVAEIGEQNNPSTNQTLDNRGMSPQQVHHSPSLADSGNFEDLNCTFAHTLEKELEKLRQTYEDMREKHNEKVEQLLKIIADSNDKYYELKPKYDTAIIRIKELEKEVDVLKSNSVQQDDLQNKLYLQLYAKQIKSEQTLTDVEKCITPLEEKPDKPKEMADLLQNLAITKKELETVKVMYRALLEASKLKTGNDAEVTLRFLKTAFFYFLTDTTNSRDHLTAIESILGYNEDEKTKIEKVQAWKY